MTRVWLKQNALQRWIIVLEGDPTRAWSGARWVEIDQHGFGVHVQVSNFATHGQALQAARQYEFDVANP